MTYHLWKRWKDGPMYEGMCEMRSREMCVGMMGRRQWRGCFMSASSSRLTRHSIQTWALEEARRRLEAEGILADPDVKKD